MSLSLRRAVCLAAVLAVAASAVAGCREKTQTGYITVKINGDRGARSFDPSDLTVTFGSFVTFVNHDGQPHTVTAPGAFDSGVIPPNGGRWTWPASIIGTFQYRSLTDPGMNGTITVVPANVQPAPAGT